MIGVTEKGVTSLELSVEGRGGHASTPAKNGPTTRIVRALLRIEKAPFTSSLPSPTVTLLTRMAPYAPIALKPLMARAEKLAPVLTRALIAAGPESAAMTRTTVAATTLSGSPALNVIASRATAGLNIRILVGDTVAGVIEHIRAAVKDKKVAINVVEANEPSPISPYDDDPAFALLEEVIGADFPDAIVSPYVMMAATDSRFFSTVCERVYRFAPFAMTKEQRQSIHSYDEWIGVDDFVAGVAWYQHLIERIR